ncbi:hypothetical protein N7462_005569 [Penicillium macrosclerotiorum]|uniref:uncharacterized protein n=1 Tax=Penicillium macrosclerotiorum TaxID=303699 RepID=UPI002548D350|nr:uncharacterized protein N7462_005569 [Penicillium macrosclerotiorum]KAJ5682404.1 hypothetical protein N7462_005569 [Penicillium macrosclerotiorum]
MADKSLKSTCHCGAITVIVPHQPEEINECQCTICRRYAAAWAYYKVNEVKFNMKEGAKLRRCYWWPLEEKTPDGGAAEFGLNTRNMDPMEILQVNRKIDNAFLFRPLNDKASAHEQDKSKY